MRTIKRYTYVPLDVIDCFGNQAIYIQPEHGDIFRRASRYESSEPTLPLVRTIAVFLAI